MEMTIDEAISWLEPFIWHEGEDVPIYNTDIEAIHMAIKALKQEPRWIPVTEDAQTQQISFMLYNDRCNRNVFPCIVE